MSKLNILGVILVTVVSCVIARPYAVKNVFANEPGQGSAGFIHASLDSLPDFAQGAFYVKPTTSANYQLAAKEYEHPLSQVISVYDHSQNKIKGFAKAEPILDNIKEEDKYGNTGDQHARAGRFIVDGIENISNVINKLFQLPLTGTRLVGRGVTEQLNKVGAKLVGL